MRINITVMRNGERTTSVLDLNDAETAFVMAKVAPDMDAAAVIADAVSFWVETTMELEA